MRLPPLELQRTVRHTRRRSQCSGCSGSGTRSGYSRAEPACALVGVRCASASCGRTRVYSARKRSKRSCCRRRPRCLGLQHAMHALAPPVLAHRSTKCIRRRGVGWRAAGRREEKHGQPVPKVERWRAHPNRDAGTGLHVAQLYPAAVSAPSFRAGWCSRERETDARWGVVDRCVALGS